VTKSHSAQCTIHAQNNDWIECVATQPNRPKRRTLTDYYNFSKAQMARSLMMVVSTETCRSTFNVNFNILLE